jgi:hypothetical protein
MRGLKRTHGVEGLGVLAFEQVDLVLCVLNFASEARCQLSVN